MGWKKDEENDREWFNRMSQSAFAGYGLEEQKETLPGFMPGRRNPLSLDMGWKLPSTINYSPTSSVAIRFRWIWVGRK